VTVVVTLPEDVAVCDIAGKVVTVTALVLEHEVTVSVPPDIVEVTISVT
jgi:hypothetical protein